MEYCETFGSVYPDILNSSFPELAELPLGDSYDPYNPEQVVAHDTLVDCVALSQTVTSKLQESIEPGIDLDSVFHELLADAPELVQEACKTLGELYDARQLCGRLRKLNLMS